MASEPVRLSDSIQFGEDFELDPRSYELRRADRVLKLERIPMELLLLLIEGRGQLVTRDQIIERIWGKDVFLDTDNSINAAIRKIRQVLKDDPEHPRFVQTITGRGYRFIAAVVEAKCEIPGRDVARELAAIRNRFSEKPAKRVEIRPTNLPVQRTGFVGRVKEVAAAKELLLRQDVRLVTVTGPGGIGKTRLAVQVASGLVERFPGGTHFISLSSLSDSGLIASVIVQTLGIREAGGQSPLEILKENLRDSLHAPMLLLLDNFEHLVQAVPTVAELLTAGPNLKILVTSRAALHVYGEHEFPVPPLALPDSRSLPPFEVLSQYPAVALFVQRAVAAKPDFGLNQENASAVTEICARLDGLPLAIELAAARIKVLSPSSMRTRLTSRLQLLTGGARDMPQRHQTLRATMDWSYDLLSAAEQRLFRRLSVFVGGCNLEGVEAVCDTKGDLDLDPLEGIASMVDKSLVQQVEQANGESRFAMLETIREYALEKLEA
ncbi:MAG TPA: winged helix-turn-helix domain-containing protein, partial [Terriglobales bacterium]|nr:winged helix-turn-helix domain-containing protein [Terriglobales bacterium]